MQSNWVTSRSLRISGKSEPVQMNIYRSSTYRKDLRPIETTEAGYKRNKKFLISNCKNQMSTIGA